MRSWLSQGHAHQCGSTGFTIKHRPEWQDTAVGLPFCGAQMQFRGAIHPELTVARPRLHRHCAQTVHAAGAQPVLKALLELLARSSTRDHGRDLTCAPLAEVAQQMGHLQLHIHHRQPRRRRRRWGRGWWRRMRWGFRHGLRCRRHGRDERAGRRELRSLRWRGFPPFRLGPGARLGHHFPGGGRGGRPGRLGARHVRRCGARCYHRRSRCRCGLRFRGRRRRGQQRGERRQERPSGFDNGQPG